ncbi:hypothetical protein J1614_002978, partial [Plenodomus biglobosus]
RVLHHYRRRPSAHSIEHSGKSSPIQHDKESASGSQPPANTAAEGWQYPPLKDAETQIRLIRILPHDGESDLRCTVTVFDRDSPPKQGYRALSYAWTDCEPRQILVDASVCHVQPNLYDFLTHVSLQQLLTPHQWAGYWWIDALCINQVHRNDNPEKIAQLSQMKEIYAGARETIIWLGTGSPSLHQSLRLIRQASNRYRTAVLEAKDGSEDDEDVQDVEELESAIRHSNILADHTFIATRVLQELVVSNQTRLVCGQEEMYFIELAIMATHTRAYFRLVQCARILDYNIKQSVPMDLATVIYQARHNWCSHGQDYIYALLGLVSAGAGQHLQPEVSTSGCNVISLAIRTILTDLETSDAAAWRNCCKLAETAEHSPLDTTFAAEYQRSNCLGAHCDPETPCSPQNCSHGPAKHCDALAVCRKIAIESCHYRTVETSYAFRPTVVDTAKSHNLLSRLFNKQPDKAVGRYTHAQSARASQHSSFYDVSTPQLTHSRQAHHQRLSYTTGDCPSPYYLPVPSILLPPPHPPTPPIPPSPSNPINPPPPSPNHAISQRSSHHRKRHTSRNRALAPEFYIIHHRNSHENCHVFAKTWVY